MKENQQVEAEIKKVLLKKTQEQKPTDEMKEDQDQPINPADKILKQKNMIMLETKKTPEIIRNPGPSTNVNKDVPQIAPVTYFYPPKPKKSRTKLSENKDHTTYVTCKTCKEVCIDKRQLASHKKKYHTSFSAMKQYYRTLHNQ